MTKVKPKKKKKKSLKNQKMFLITIIKKNECVSNILVEKTEIF